MKKLLLPAVLLFCASAVHAQAAPVHSNTLTWLASPTANVTGYNVYKASGSCTATFAKLTTTPITALTFVDTGMADGAVNCYYVSAVSATGETPQSMCPMVLLTTPTNVAALTPAPPGRGTSTSQ